MLVAGGAVGVALLATMFAYGQPPQGGGDGPQGGQHDNQHGGRRPVYQRRAFEWMHADHDRRRDGYGPGRWETPQVSAGWFQRPYPYHLDYYKMRYGGSYAPYFGNLYGPPQVVYGGWGWGAGGWGAEYGGYGGQPNGFQGIPYSNSMMPEASAESANSGNGQAASPKGESLPAPSQ